ncbi:MAG: hypothetical protein ACTSXP_02700 [Promethearchaeota archaeon]
MAERAHADLFQQGGVVDVVKALTYVSVENPSGGHSLSDFTSSRSFSNFAKSYPWFRNVSRE